MATKAKVIKLLKAQGAEWEVESNDPFTFSAWLPAELIWDTGYGSGIVTQEKYDDETWAEFWDGVLSVIEGDVIPKP